MAWKLGTSAACDLVVHPWSTSRPYRVRGIIRRRGRGNRHHDTNGRLMFGRGSSPVRTRTDRSSAGTKGWRRLAPAAATVAGHSR